MGWCQWTRGVSCHDDGCRRLATSVATRGGGNAGLEGVMTAATDGERRWQQWWTRNHEEGRSAVCDNGCGGNGQEETAKREPLEAAAAVKAYAVKHLIPKNGDGLDISWDKLAVETLWHVKYLTKLKKFNPESAGENGITFSQLYLWMNFYLRSNPEEWQWITKKIQCLTSNLFSVEQLDCASLSPIQKLCWHKIARQTMNFQHSKANVWCNIISASTNLESKQCSHPKMSCQFWT